MADKGRVQLKKKSRIFQIKWVGGFEKVHFPDLKNKKYALKMHKNAKIVKLSLSLLRESWHYNLFPPPPPVLGLINI